MKVIILEAFAGYPVAPDKVQNFVPGPDPIDVPDDFGALIVQKGHAKAAEARAARARPAQRTEPDAAPAGGAPAEAPHEAQ